MTNNKLSSLPFNNKLFREITNDTCKAINQSNIGLQVISPFGFELFENKSYLNKTLRKFYCYIGVPIDINIPLHEIAHMFYELLINNITKVDPKFSNKIVLKILQDKFIKLRPTSYICQIDDKLIDIQCRHIKKPIIEDYADYLICSIQAIHDNKDESKEFMTNARFRSRTYQLYAMLECIFGGMLSTMPLNQKLLYEKVFSKINNSVEIFFDDSKLNAQANREDNTIMQYLIKPRISSMIKAIQGNGSYMQLNTTSYHVKDKLGINISRQIYCNAINKIKYTYEQYI